MWWWLAAFVVSLLVTYAVMSMIPKPETGKPPEVEEFDGPTAIDGREITVLFGTRNFPDLQVHWWGDVRTGPRKDADTGDIVVGYHYYVGMHLIACLGPVDFLSGVWVDERPLYYSPEGEATGGSILVDNLDLFGGPAGEGGVKGYIDVEMGLPAQGRNSYLEHNLDGGDAPGDFEAHDIPAFRGVVGLVLKSIYIGHTPYLKKWMIRLQRIHLRQDGIEQWYDAKAAIPVYCGEAIDIEYTNDVAIAIVYDLSYSNRTADAGIDAQNTIGYALSNLVLAYKQDLLIADPEATMVLSAYAAKYAGGAADTQSVEGTDGQFDTAMNWISGGGYGPTPTITNHTEGSKNLEDFFNAVPITTKKICVFVGDGIDDYWISGFYEDTPNAPTKTAVAVQLALLQTDLFVMPYAIHQGYIGSVDILQLMDSPPVPDVTTSGEAAAAITAIWNATLLETGSNIPNEGDMNPAHIIRECLTDPDWGINGDEASPDETAFVYAADYLYNENMGISLKWTAQSDIEEFIELVKKHINAELYPDHATGKFILKLIRDDYDVASLPILSESDIVKVENAKRPLIGDLVNSVTVQYWDTCIGEDSSVTVQDSALIHMQGKEINTTVQYPGFTYKDIAVRVATRDLRALSSQLLSCTLYAKRTAEILNLGSVFVMHWPDLDISGVVMRVQDIDFGDGRKNTIKIDAVEDVFGLPATVVVGDDDNDPGWVPPIQDAEPLAHELAVEAPYYELLQKYGETELTAKLSANPDLGYALAGGIRVTNSDIDAVISADDGSGYVDVGRMDLCGGVEITADVDQIEKAWDYTGGIDLDRMEIGTHAQIDDELVVIESIVQTDAIAGTITVGRAVLDTSPRDHSSGSRLVAWDEYNYIDDTEYDDEDTVSLKIRPTTGHGTLALADAAALPVVMDSRALRPYPPGNLQVDDVAYPADDVSGGFVASWAHRDRLTQGITPHPDGDTGPEAGTTYDLIIKDSVGTTKASYIDLTNTSQTVDLSAFSNGAYTLKILSKRNSVVSWDSIEWAFTVIDGISTPITDQLQILDDWTTSNVTITKPDEYIVTVTLSSAAWARLTLTGLTDGLAYMFMANAYVDSANAVANVARIAIEASGAQPDGSVIAVEDSWEELFIPFVASGTTQDVYLQCANGTQWGAIGDVAKFTNVRIEAATGSPDLATDLITNGSFISNTDGWHGHNATLAATNQELNITKTGIWYSSNQQVNIVNDNAYLLKVDKTNENVDDFITLGPSNSNNANVGPVFFGVHTVANSGIGIGSYQYDFIANVDTYLWLGSSIAASVSATRKFDNVSLHRAIYEIV